MALIDLPLLAELLVVLLALLLLVATLETAAPKPPAQPLPPTAAAPAGWQAEHDPHAQRILRLEARAMAPRCAADGQPAGNACDAPAR